jgi:putative acetyltransferase
LREIFCLYSSGSSLQAGPLQATFGGFYALVSMTITVSPEDPRAPEAQALLTAFVDEIRRRYDAPPADVGYFDPSVVSVPKSAFLVARVEGRAVGCGALVPLEDDVVEIKRMFVLPQERGHGIAKKILDRLQSLAQEFDYDRIRLETGTKQPESIALYGKSGFYRVPNFPPFENDHTAVCFEKRI